MMINFLITSTKFINAALKRDSTKFKVKTQKNLPELPICQTKILTWKLKALSLRNSL